MNAKEKVRRYYNKKQEYITKNMLHQRYEEERQ